MNLELLRLNFTCCDFQNHLTRFLLSRTISPMTFPQLLHTMCTDLPDADLNAIRKARGFSTSETASRTSFASFYVTAVGVAENMAALTPEEAITLRLLHETGEVAVAFFERLYGMGKQRGTYSQRYKTTFDTVKKNLVRRGLVVMSEAKTRSDDTLMERWRFALPPEFAPFLPSLPVTQNSSTGLENENTLRKKLTQILGQNQDLNDSMPLALKSGSLYLKDQSFTLTTFRDWQLFAWNRALLTYQPNAPTSLIPTTAALKLLDAQTWIKPKDITPALKIYSFGGKIPPAEELLQSGWELGLLSRLEIDSVPHYRLAPALVAAGLSAPLPASLDWADTASKPGSVKIDLRLIPLHDLDLLNTLTHLAVENGALYAFPSLVKLGRALPAQRKTPLSLWLAENVSVFGKAIETVNEKWGKTILHETLLIARVRDLSLRVQLEREFKENIVVLEQHYVAFPPAWRTEVEKVLKKAGFVVKMVKA